MKTCLAMYLLHRYEARNPHGDQELRQHELSNFFKPCYLGYFTGHWFTYPELVTGPDGTFKFGSSAPTVGLLMWKACSIFAWYNACLKAICVSITC